MNMKALLFPILLAAMQFVYAQYPATDIYLLNVRFSKANKVRLTNPRKIYENKGGYDNQPSFSPDGKTILFSSVKADEKQSDIYAYSIHTQQVTKLTNTTESEFSPIVTPDKKHFSTVRIENDADSTQRMWIFDYNSNTKKSQQTDATVLMENVKKIGYYRWITENVLSLFILNTSTSNSLKLVDVRNPNPQMIADSIGRTLALVPKEATLSFVVKTDENHFLIKKYNFHTQETHIITHTLPQVEDFAWHPKGFLVAAKEGVLYTFTPKKDKTWQAVADLQTLNIKGITRLSLNKKGNKLVLVGKE